MALSSFAALSVDSLEQEVRALVELVRLSRVTVLIAEQGSDKSVVLRSMIMPLLQDGRSGKPREIAVLFDWWKKAPLTVLKARIDAALAQVVGDAAYAMEDQSSADLAARLAERERAFDCKFVIVLDRFEEYLAAPSDDDEMREFETQFVDAVNSRTVSANFVLSLDERAVPRLARLHELIPGLNDAQVRLSKLVPERVGPASAHQEADADRLVGSPAPLAQGPTARTNAAEPDVALSRPSIELHGEIATMREAVVPGDVYREPHDDIDSRESGTASSDAADAPQKRSWTRAAITLVVVLVIVSTLALLGIRRAGEYEHAPSAAAPASPSAGANMQAQREPDGNAPAKSSTTVASPPEAIRDHETPQPQVTVEPPAAEPAPSTGSMAIPAARRSAASEASGPLLYIVIGDEAQRAYAERMATTLARRGIRVGGIRVTPGGPPLSDLRYFHSADRARAATINRALDVVGRPAQRLRYVPGFEHQAPPDNYELWLPAR